MQQLVGDLGGVVDQLNPLSRQNQIVFMIWLAAYVFLLGAVWRCGRRWMRLIFLLLVQVLSVGLFVSQANIVILAIYLWRESLLLAAGAMAFSIWLFRERRKAGAGGIAPVPATGIARSTEADASVATAEPASGSVAMAGPCAEPPARPYRGRTG